MKKSECDYSQSLMMWLINQKLTPEEARKVNEHLIKCQTCRDKYEHLCNADGKLIAVTFIEPTDREVEHFGQSPYYALVRKAGIGLVLGGLAALVLYGGYQSFTYFDWQQFLNDEKTVIPKLGISALVIGALLLLLDVIHERRGVFKIDPYKNIKR